MTATPDHKRRAAPHGAVRLGDVAICPVVHTIRVAIAALSIASIAAYAGESEGAVQAPVDDIATVRAAPAPTGHIAYVTQSSGGANG